MAILLFTLLTGAIRTIGTAIDINSTNIKNKKKAIEEGKDTYMDHNHILHHIENDQPFMYQTDWETNELWEINPYNHAKLRNVSAENRNRICEENRLKAIREGRYFYPCEHRSKDHSREYGMNDITGYRYRRVDNDEIYVKRAIGKLRWVDWYMNIRTKKFEYYDAKNCRYSSSELEKEMKRLNSEQERMMETGYDEYGHKVTMYDINQNCHRLSCEVYDNGI